MGILSLIFNQQKVVINPIGEDRKGFFGRVKGAALDSLNMGLTGIVIDATVSEEHVFDSDVTKNPVEDGADITDHVRLHPARLTIEGVISDTPLGYAVIGNIQNLVRSVSVLFGGKSRSIDAFDELIKLREKRTPFTIITSLKKYDNMILKTLSLPRTAETGAAIHFTAIMEEMLIVKSEETLNLSESARNIGAKTKDVGQKVTESVPVDAKVSQDSSIIFDIFN